MRLSVIIVTHNGKHHLEECLNTLAPQVDENVEVIVVDNGSSDGTTSFVESLNCPGIRLVPLGKNLGFASGNSIGASEAQGAWFFLLNNDTRCAPTLVEELRNGIREHPEFSVFACRMVRTSDGKIDNKGIRMTRFLRAAQIGTGTDNRAEEPFEIFGASGGAMLVQRSVVEDIGLFEPEFFAYHEDVDFAVRARMAGYRCLYLPRAVVYHKGGGTSSHNKALFLYYLQRNMELALLRNLPIRLAWKYAPGRLAYCVFQLAKWTLRGQAKTVVKAKWDAYRLWAQHRWQLPPPRITMATFERFLVDDFSVQIRGAVSSSERVVQG